MSTINIDLAADTILNVMIGQQDENEVREVVFDFSGWYTTYGSGTISLAIQRPKDEWPYEGTLTVDSTNHEATWEISDTDTAYAGTGQIQLSYKVGDAKKKSVVYRFTCHKSLGALGSVVTPVQIQTFIDEVEEALQTMDGRLDDMDDQIADVKQDLNDTKNLLGVERKTPDASADNYGLTSTGYSVYNTDYKHIKYKVVAGESVWIKCPQASGGKSSFQFQDDSAVSQSNIDHLIGTPVSSETSGFVTVPTGATWVIFGILKTDTESGVYSVSSIDNINNDIDNINQYLDGTNIAYNEEEHPSTWEKGTWHSTNGSKYSVNTYIRPLSEFNISDGNIKMVVSSGYFAKIFAYDKTDNYVGVYCTDGTFAKTWNNHATVNEFLFYKYPNYVFKIAISRDPASSDIAITEGVNCTIITSLSFNNKKDIDEYVKNIKYVVPWTSDMHRGYSSATVHENTIQAFYRAWQNGADWIEVDARLTSDGKYVASHDATVTVGGVTYTIANETADTLTHLVLSTDPVYGDCCIPLLETVLNLCCYTGMRANVDCKSIYPTTLATLVVDCGMSGRVMYANMFSVNASTILSIDPNAGFIFEYSENNLASWANAVTDYHTRNKSYAWSNSISYDALEKTRAYGFKYLLAGVQSTTLMPYAPDCIEFESNVDCKELNETYLNTLSFFP